MVFIITGAATSDRNTLGRLLADTLGWDFVEPENLRPPASLDADTGGASSAKSDSRFPVETLIAAIELWLYEWRNAVVSWRVLTEKERGQLAKMSSLVKIVCLQPFNDATCAPVINLRAGDETSQIAAGLHAEQDLAQNVLAVDSSQQVAELVAKLAAALVGIKSLHAEISW